MSVLKNQRELSKMEFYKNGLALRREMRKWLSSDFGSKPRLKDLQIVEYNISDEDKATIQEILDRNEINHSKAFQRKEPEWNIDEEKKYLKKKDKKRGPDSADDLEIKEPKFGSFLFKKGNEYVRNLRNRCGQMEWHNRLEQSECILCHL